MTTIYVIVGKQILSQMERGKFGEAVVAFLAVFYLLDYDYPKHWEIGMNMFQYFVFEDRNPLEDLSVSFNQVLKQYKSEPQNLSCE